MKCIIVAGGLGTRMRPLTNEIPKSLIRVNGKTIIEYQIEQLKKYGINEIIICIGYLGKKIKNYVGDGKKFGVNVKYSEEKEPLGTGGAIKNAEKFIDGTFLVLYGDILFDTNLKKLIDFHKENHALVTLVLHESDHPYDSDLIEVEGNKVKRILGKHRTDVKTNITKTSLYVMEPDIFKIMPDGKHDLENDILPLVIKNGKCFGYFTNEFIRDIGTLERLKEIKNFLVL